MPSNSEKAVLDGVGLDEENLSIEDLLASFEADLALQRSDLSILEEEYDKIGNPDNLGSIIKDVIWEQFVNQVKTSLGAEAADTFIKGNNNLPLDLRNSAHIQTAENFAEGKIAAHNHISSEQLEQNYDRFAKTPHQEFRKQHVDPGMNSTLERAGQLEKKGIDKVTDIYTGKQIPTNTKLENGKSNPDAAQREHVKPSAELYRNPSLQMANSDQALADIINDPENLQGYTTAKRNIRKSDKTAAEMDEQDKTKHWEAADKRAEEFIKQKEKEGEERLKKEGRKTQKDEAFRIGEQALRAVLMQLLVDLIKEIIDKLVKWLKAAKKGLGTLLESLKEAIDSFVGKMITHLVNAGNTFFSTVISTIIIDPVLKTIKRVWSLLNQSFKAVADAIVYIRNPENKGKPFGRLLMEVGKIVIASITGVGATLLSEVIEGGLRSIPPFGVEIPVIGSLANILGMFLGAVVAGIIGAILINIIDRHITRQQKNENLDSQIGKQNEILNTQDKILGVEVQLTEKAKVQTARSIRENREMSKDIISEAMATVFREDDEEDNTSERLSATEKELAELLS